MDYRSRWEIEREERIREEARIRTREDVAERRLRAQDQAVEKILRYQTYVNLHGPEGAYWLTVKKWTIGGAIFAVGGFFINLAEKGFFDSLMGAAVCFGVAVAIGFTRAKHILEIADIGNDL